MNTNLNTQNKALVTNRTLIVDNNKIDFIGTEAEAWALMLKLSAPKESKVIELTEKQTNSREFFTALSKGEVVLVDLSSTSAVENKTQEIKKDSFKIKSLVITLALSIITGGIARGFGF